MGNLESIVDKHEEIKSEETIFEVPALRQTLGDLELSPEHVKPFYHEIMQGLLLGNCRIATDLSKLESLGVTHVLNTAEGTGSNQILTGSDFYGTDIKYFGIPGSDEESFDLSEYFDQGADFIREAIGTRDNPNKNGKILVHCMAGVSRSATIVLVYMIRDHQMDLLDALKTARRKRYIYPNDGFLQQLIDYSKKLNGSS